jgi:arabinogalactan oligomer/maltooligosaccharide transport system permease protein
MTDSLAIETTQTAEPAVPVQRRKRKRMTPFEAVKLVFTYIFLVFIAMLVLLPIVYILTMSLNAEKSLYIDTVFPTKYSFDAFARLFTETQYLTWYGNTLIVGAMTAAGELLLVLPTSYALSRLKFKGRKNYLMVFLVLQMFPGTMSMVAYYVLLNMLGLIDTYFGIVIVFSCTAVPGSTFMMKGFFDTIPKSIEEAAMLDGATRLQCVARIIIPLAMPMIGLICLFGFSAPFGDYMLSKILITDPGKYTLALGTYQGIYSQSTTDYALFAAAAILSALPMAVIYMILQKTIVNGLGGATK